MRTAKTRPDLRLGGGAILFHLFGKKNSILAQYLRV